MGGCYQAQHLFHPVILLCWHRHLYSLSKWETNQVMLTVSIHHSTVMGSANTSNNFQEFLESRVKMWHVYSVASSTKECEHVRRTRGNVGAAVHFIPRMILRTKRSFCPTKRASRGSWQCSPEDAPSQSRCWFTYCTDCRSICRDCSSRKWHWSCPSVVPIKCQFQSLSQRNMCRVAFGSHFWQHSFPPCYVELWYHLTSVYGRGKNSSHCRMKTSSLFQEQAKCLWGV